MIKSGVGAPAALAVAAVWAGVRLYENRVRDDRAAGAVPGASIVPLPGRRRA